MKTGDGASRRRGHSGLPSRSPGLHFPRLLRVLSQSASFKSRRALASGTTRHGRLPPEKGGRESPPQTTFAEADTWPACAPPSRPRLTSPAALPAPGALPRVRGGTRANLPTWLAAAPPALPPALATVARGRGSASRSWKIPAAHEYLQIQRRPRPRCLGAQAPQPRGRKNNPKSKRAPGEGGRPGPRPRGWGTGADPSGESRARLWVRGRRPRCLLPCRGETEAGDEAERQ